MNKIQSKALLELLTEMRHQNSVITKQIGEGSRMSHVLFGSTIPTEAREAFFETEWPEDLAGLIRAIEKAQYTLDARKGDLLRFLESKCKVVL